MQYSRTDIIETERANKLKYYLSVAQKQNDSGVFFNERLLFILSAQHFGYISQVALNQRPQDINFEKAKTTVPLQNIRGVSFQARELKIRFNISQGNKISERNWLIRFANDILCRKWYDLFQKERTLAAASREPQPQPVAEPPQAPPAEVKVEKQKKPLEIVSRNMELSEQVQVEKQTKQMGTSISPRNVSQMSRQRPNYQEQLAKIMGQGSSNLEESSSKKQPEPDQSTRTQRMKDREIRSEPSYKHDNLSHRLLEASKNSDESNISSSNPQNSKKNRTEVRQSRLIEDDDISPIQRFNKHRLFEEKYSIAQVGSQEKDKGFIRTALFQKYLGSKLDLPINETETAQLAEQKRSSFPTSLQMKPRYFQNPLKTTQATRNTTPWTFKYVKYNHLIFHEFGKHTEVLLKELVEDLSQPSDARKYKQKLNKNGIAYYEIQDIEVKVASISLESLGTLESSVTERVSSKTALKVLQNEFKNYNSLYELLGDSVQLRVPLVSLCEYRGFIALFKILSRSHEKYVKNRQLSKQIQELKTRSKIDCTFNENINRVIIELDDEYYNSLKKEEEDVKVNFRLYFIQEIDHYLLPDLLSDPDPNGTMVVRKELLKRYPPERPAIKNFESDVRKHVDPFEDREHKRDLEELSRELLQAIAEAVEELDSMSVYFMNSGQLSSYFHSKGINIRYLGYIYESLKTTFQKRIMMTEMATRSCKLLLRKTLQDIISEQGNVSEKDLNTKLCDFLNCLLGKSYQTAEFWKVLSAHSQVCFGLDLNFHQIDRWFFVISLVQNCRLVVDWDKIRVEEAFKTDQFWEEFNLLGLACHHKTFEPIYSEYYRLGRAIVESQETRDGFDRLINYLNLKTEPIPEHLCSIRLQVKRYLAYFISPEKAAGRQYSHLRIYEWEGEGPSRLGFEIMLIEIKWYLKLKQKQEYIRRCNDFLRVANKYYGEFHPIFSQLYDLFSAYHLTNAECEDAITFAKSSLVNILKICGTNHEKTSESYYHLSLCYIKANKQSEAITHLQKAQFFFESTARTDTIGYAIMCLKLGLLYLNQNQVSLSLDTTSQALAIFEAYRDQCPQQYQDQVTQCYEIMARGYEILEDKVEMKELSTHCLTILKGISKITNLEKMLKIYLYPVLASLRPETASTYIDIISALPPLQTTEDMLETSFKLLRQRLDEESLSPNFRAYLEKLAEIQRHVRESQLLENWKYFKQMYERQTVKDFVSLTTELLAFLGEGFVVGSLREAL